MKKVAYVTIYQNAFSGDRFFDNASDKLGQNLREPYIKLKEQLEKKGHTIHTVDMYENLRDVDFFIFQNIWGGCIRENLTRSKLKYYIKKAQYKIDYLLRTWLVNKRKKLLIISEPPVVSARSYDKSYHKQFGAVLTWNDDLVDNKKYFKLSVAQPVSNYRGKKSFNERNFLSMICSNKKSDGAGELYSERRKVIDFFEQSEKPFDLWGYGWEKGNLKNYKGTTSEKLLTLSNYKFSICFENMTHINGYITEKIFDCFFAGSIPVYWGADNIDKYIPSDCYIDFRNFKSLDELILYLEKIDEKQYKQYIDNICAYLDSKKFTDEFSVETYVNRILRFVEQV